jgi:hypothetical protein
MYNTFSVPFSKFHHLAWCAVLALSLAACGGADDPSSTAAQSSATTSAATQPFILNGVPQSFVEVGTLYRYMPSASGSNGRVLSYDIANKPDWATFVEASGELSGTPDASNVGPTAEIEIGVFDGTTRATVGPFQIRVIAPESPATPSAPATIAGTPFSTVTAGQPYSFSPIVTDPSGAALSFSIVNRPAWATFSTATGALSGRPTTANAGTFTHIVISVSTDGTPISLPAFSIEVQAAYDSAPTISGTPVTKVAAGGSYSFTPFAGDPDGNALTFSILNAPSWASFSTKTGELSGTAPATATALFSNIVISVSDGTSTASLAPFGITVTAPTQNGVCGAANGTAVATAPTGGLCSTGTASAVSGSGPWAWSCAAANVGTTASCSASVASSGSGTRNPLQQPFATNSIWNMPIGNGAAFAPANLTANPASSDSGATNIAWAVVFGSDAEHIILTPTAPLTSIYYEGNAWSGASRCDATSTGAVSGLPVSVPIPATYTVPSDNGNDGAAVLAADGQTIIQFQPMALCTAGGPGTAAAVSPAVNLYGPGILGAHGGSGMSSIGGSIRVGEMRPGQVGMHHALKVDMNYYEYYHASAQANSYRWPSVTSDGAWQNYGLTSAGAQGANYSNPAMVMGALLAIPSTISISSLNLQTEPGKQLAWTLQNYGAYIVDSSMDCCFNFSEEESPAGSFSAQFQADWGYPMLARFNTDSAWSQDIETIRTALQVVSNNGPNSIGGGGTPLQPLAPQISPP